MKRFLPRCVLVILITIIAFNGTVQAADGSNSVFFNIKLDGDGEAWGNIRKPGGAALRFHATRKNGGWTTPWPDSRRFLEEEKLPTYVDVEWYMTHSDVVPDNRRYSVRLPIRSKLPDQVAAPFDLYEKQKRSSNWYRLNLNLVLKGTEIELSWKYKKLWKSWNPLHYFKYMMNPTGIPPRSKTLGTGGPLNVAAEVQGDAPRLSEVERNAIIRQNKLTKKLAQKIKGVEELTSADVPWIKTALSSGADVEGMSVYEKMQGNIYRPNFTLLMLAAGNGTPELINLLLEHGAKINAMNVNGDTPLIYAVLSGRVENVKLLLMHGADPNMQNQEKMSSLSYARQQSLDKVVEVLIKAGAKE